MMQRTLSQTNSVALAALAAGALTINATAYTFQGVDIAIDHFIGTGDNETVLVVDWNLIDTGPTTLSSSHAFSYRWNGNQTVLDMLNAFDNAGVLDVTTGYGGAFLLNIEYIGPDSEAHSHTESGSWNLASTLNPNANWGTWNNSEWDFNTMGIDVEPLADGQFEGINAILFFGTPSAYVDDQLDIPLVPAPVTAAAGTLGLALLAVRRGSR